MMNLNAYDNVTEKINKTKTWVDIRKKQLISKEIKIRPYISILKRYDIKNNTISYFIATLDTPPLNHTYTNITIDDYGRIKLNISSIWEKTFLSRLKQNSNISIEHVDSDEDGDVYLLDV